MADVTTATFEEMEPIYDGRPSTARCSVREVGWRASAAREA